jgi:glucosamine-6-phosphate deaminase
MKALFRKVDSYEKLSQLAALEIKKKIQGGNRVNLGLPTGGTPIGMYKELVNDPHLDWWNVTTFNLDEYIGISVDHHESYQNFMNRNLFNHIDINRFNIWFPDQTSDYAVYDYDAMIQTAGGLDLTILGIGTNGHIAFNEPGSPFNSTTRVVDLDKQTIKDNSRFFNSIEEVPTQAITMGLETIMKSKEILLIAQGKKKLDIIQRAMFGKITEEVPASILQEHDNLTILYCE